MNKKAFKKLYILLAILLVLILSLTSIVYAWVSRSGLSGTATNAPGFFYKESAYMLYDSVNIKTSYIDQNGDTVLLSDGYTSQDLLSSISLLIPGERTDFVTEISNNSKNTVSVSAYFKNIVAGSGIADYVWVCAYDPDFHMYKKENMHMNSSSDYVKESAPMAQNISIEAGKTASIKWYIYATSDIESGSFKALKVNESLATQTDLDGNKYYYMVSEVDRDSNEVLCAFLCNAYGALVDSDFNLIGNTEPVKYVFDSDTYAYENVEYIIVRTQDNVIDITDTNAYLSIDGIFVR